MKRPERTSESLRNLGCCGALSAHDGRIAEKCFAPSIPGSFGFSDTVFWLTAGAPQAAPQPQGGVQVVNGLGTAIGASH